MTDHILTDAELLSPAKAGKLSATWMTENVLNPALNAGPLNIYNTAADLVHLPTLHLKTDEAKPYSTEWFTQSVSSGVGAALPFMIAGAATGHMMKAGDRMLSGTALGATLNPYLQSEKIAMVAGASLYGALQKPDANHTRLGNAIGIGVGMAVFTKGNDMVKDLSMLQKAVAYPAIGFIGGGVMTEASQLASNGKLANGDVALQGAVQGATMNTLLPLAQEAISKKLAQDQATYNNRVEAAQQAEALRALYESKFEGKNVKVQGLADSKSAFDEIARVSKQYSEFVRDNQPKYPHPDDFANMSPEDIVKAGFHHEDASNLEILNAFKGDKKPRPLPDAKVVASEVAKIMSKMPNAEDTGNLRIGEWNMEFLTADKAKYFADTYKQIIPKHHLLFVEEANEAGLKQIAKDTGYNYAISAENSRGQAVGFLIHPRLEVTKTTSIDSVANVDNIPDLRPAFRVDLKDSANGENISGVVVHLKSMRGGPEATAAVRAQQAQILANELGPNFKGIIAGDWNTFLDKTTELNALKTAGFQLANPNSSSSTQSMGGRLDGFMHKGLTGTLAEEMVNPFFKNPLITRGLSDHALLTTELIPSGK